MSESCGRRFVKDEGSSTGYIQCVWKGAPRNSCDMWSGEDVRSAKECEAPQTNGKPTCAHGLGRDGNGGAWQSQPLHLIKVHNVVLHVVVHQVQLYKSHQERGDVHKFILYL